MFRDSVRIVQESRPWRQDVISELRRGYDELTQSQKRIAEAIVEDPEFVAFATVDKIAARLERQPVDGGPVRLPARTERLPGTPGAGPELVRLQMRLNAATGDGDRDLTAHLGDTVFARSLAPRPRQSPAHDPEPRGRRTSNAPWTHIEGAPGLRRRGRHLRDRVSTRSSRSTACVAMPCSSRVTQAPAAPR